MTYRVRYYLGPHSGVVFVNAEDPEEALAKARKKVRAETTLPMASERYEIENKLPGEP